MSTTTTRDVRDLARPLRDAADLDPLLERVGDARIVCVGEASHGTHEFYRWREQLTRRLVLELGFDLVAVEGDWPDCERVSRSVTGRGPEPGQAPEPPLEALRAFARWPTWMWANEEVADFADWLREHNATRPPEHRVGFHGLDVYSLWESLRAVLDHLHEHHPQHLEAALEACRCFEPYAEDPVAYARATRLVPETCEHEVVGMLTDLVDRHPRPTESTESPEDAFAAEQDARAAVGAEAYYRAMVRGGSDSWNVRDRHMADTLDRLLDHYDARPGRDAPARAVVWEHNTHVGDARFTDMASAGMVNVGQLVRERHGEADCVLVGFGSHRGTVVAAEEWGRPMRTMRVPPARAGSVEDLLHDALDGDRLFVFPDERPGWAAEEADHRAIGVVYRPHAERWGNYVPTVLGRRYDAFLWCEETRALRPLHAEPRADGELETWPYGG